MKFQNINLVVVYRSRGSGKVEPGSGRLFITWISNGNVGQRSLRVVAKKWRVRMNPRDVSKKEMTRFGPDVMYQEAKKQTDIWKHPVWIPRRTVRPLSEKTKLENSFGKGALQAVGSRKTELRWMSCLRDQRAKSQSLRGHLQMWVGEEKPTKEKEIEVSHVEGDLGSSYHITEVTWEEF